MHHRYKGVLIMDWRTVTTFVLMILPASPIMAEDRPSAPTVPELIATLHSDQFLERESATTALIEAGEPAIDSVAKAIRVGDVEIITRCVFVLRHLALSEDRAAAKKADETMSALAKNARPLVAQRIRRALASLYEVRRKQSLTRLRSLGAKDRTAKTQFGMQFAQVMLSLRIDDDWRGNKGDLEYLVYLTDFDQLTFVGPQVGDDWLEVVQRMPNLRSLILKHTNVTGKGLSHLQKLPRLDRVGLFYSSIDDSAVENLGELRGVSFLQLYGTKLSEEAANRLNEIMDQTMVDFKRGAFMGVGGQANTLGCEISRVSPQSAADKAGIRIGDVILEYEGAPIKTFESLTSIIAKNFAGDKVTVKLLQNGRETERKIVLGEGNWEDR